MKKILCLGLIILILASFVGCSAKNDNSTPTNANDSADDYSYSKLNDYVILNLYLGADKTPEIPEKIEGLPVKIIGTGCFAGSKVEVVTIPETVTEIWETAFLNCRNLKSITLNEKITKINIKTFEGCEALETVALPENLEIIEHHAFLNCKNLKTIEIPATVSKIDYYAFYDTGLTEVNFSGDAPTEWGESVFGPDTQNLTLYHPADAHGWDDEKFSAYTLSASNN